jgi:hypothetical protein
MPTFQQLSRAEANPRGGFAGRSKNGPEAEAPSRVMVQSHPTAEKGGQLLRTKATGRGEVVPRRRRRKLDPARRKGRVPGEPRPTAGQGESRTRSARRRDGRGPSDLPRPINRSFKAKFASRRGRQRACGAPRPLDAPSAAAGQAVRQRGPASGAAGDVPSERGSGGQSGWRTAGPWRSGLLAERALGGAGLLAERALAERALGGADLGGAAFGRSVYWWSRAAKRALAGQLFPFGPPPVRGRDNRF